MPFLQDHFKAKDPNEELREIKKTLFHVLHQRTGPLGEKVEDILQRENEELLLACIKHTRDL